jgi:hypothetical protein
MTGAADSVLATAAVHDLLAAWCDAFSRGDGSEAALFSGAAPALYDGLARGGVYSAANIAVTVDGASARAESYLYAAGSTAMQGVRCHDRFIRVEGAWRFAERRVIADWECVLKQD